MSEEKRIYDALLKNGRDMCFAVDRLKWITCDGNDLPFWELKKYMDKNPDAADALKNQLLSEIENEEKEEVVVAFEMDLPKGCLRIDARARNLYSSISDRASYSALELLAIAGLVAAVRMDATQERQALQKKLQEHNAEITEEHTIQLNALNISDLEIQESLKKNAIKTGLLQHYLSFLKRDEKPLFRGLEEQEQKKAILQKNFLPYNMWGAELVGHTLSKADLSGAILPFIRCSSVLTGADLENAVLVYADLKSAYLKKAHLTGAQLIGADLRGAVLMHAALIASNLTGVDARKAYFKDANLRMANLTDADLREATGLQMLAGAILQRANVSNADLRNAVLENTDFTDADLTNADIRNANIKSANFTNTRLEGALLNVNSACSLLDENVVGVSEAFKKALEKGIVQEIKNKYEETCKGKNNLGFLNAALKITRLFLKLNSLKEIIEYTVEKQVLEGRNYPMLEDFTFRIPPEIAALNQKKEGYALSRAY